MSEFEERRSRQALIEFIERCLESGQAVDATGRIVAPHVVLDFAAPSSRMLDADWFYPLPQLQRQRISYF
jgi:hypothetical protein